MGQLAERVGVRTPSLYSHIVNQDDLNRRIAALAFVEAAEAIRAGTQGHAGRDALGAAARAFRTFVLTHPGRYAATIGVDPVGPDDLIAVAGARLVDSLTAVLESYGVGPDDMDHALRALRSFFHGFATLQAAHGFQWPTDIDESYEWLIALVDRGLRSPGPAGPSSGRAPGGRSPSSGPVSARGAAAGDPPSPPLRHTSTSG